MMVFKQIWGKKPYNLVCSGCNFVKKIFVKQPLRKCPMCNKKLDNFTLLKNGEVIFRGLV